MDTRYHIGVLRGMLPKQFPLSISKMFRAFDLKLGVCMGFGERMDCIGDGHLGVS